MKKFIAIEYLERTKLNIHLSTWMEETSRLKFVHYHSQEERRCLNCVLADWMEL